MTLHFQRNGEIEKRTDVDEIIEPLEPFDVVIEKGTDSDFENDIRTLLERDDIRCRLDICNAEFSKAEKLLNNHNEADKQKAYSIIKNLAELFEWAPACLWLGDYAANEKHNNAKAMEWYKKASSAWRKNKDS